MGGSRRGAAGDNEDEDGHGKSGASTREMTHTVRLVVLSVDRTSDLVPEYDCTSELY